MNSAGLKVGTDVTDLVAFDADGSEFQFADLKGGYTVIVFGCLT